MAKLLLKERVLLYSSEFCLRELFNYNNCEKVKCDNNSKVKVLDDNYRVSLQGLDVNLAGKTQQIAEAVLKSSREMLQINNCRRNNRDNIPRIK